MKFSSAVRRKLSAIFELREDSDFFALLDLQLVVSAIRVRSRRLVVLVPFRLYQLLLPIQCTIWLVRIWVVAAFERNTALAISLTCGGLAVTSILLRYGLMLHCCEKFGAVRAYINARRFLRGHPMAHAIRQQAFRTNNLILVLLQLVGLINVFVFTAFDVHQHEVFRIPDYIRRTSEPLFWAMHVTVQPMVLCGLATLTGTFLVPNALLIGLHAELQLVQFAFERALQLADTRVRQKDHQLDAEARADLIWHTLDHELGCCVREHCVVLQYVRKVRQTMSFSVTVQYFTALLALAVDGFFISYQGFDFVVFMVVVYSMLLVFEWFYCCKLVEDLQAIHHRIGSTLYHGNWPAWLACSERHRSSLRQFRDTLCTVLAVSQRSLSCHGSAIVEVSWRTFSNLFKTSYSVLMFLIELRRMNRANIQ
uniref:Uncharacterized protein n=1 Tax=Anopheles atroparvus TaxID=41427 RepID=A0A182JF72_ANOAO